MGPANRHLEFARGIARRYLDSDTGVSTAAELVFLHPAIQPVAGPVRHVTTVYDIHNITRCLVQNQIFNLSLALRFTGSLLEKTVRESARTQMRQIAMLEKEIQVVRRENRVLLEQRRTGDRSKTAPAIAHSRDPVPPGTRQQFINLETVAAIHNRYERSFAAFYTFYPPDFTVQAGHSPALSTPIRSGAEFTLSPGRMASGNSLFAFGPALLSHLTRMNVQQEQSVFTDTSITSHIHTGTPDPSKRKIGIQREEESRHQTGTQPVQQAGFSTHIQMPGQILPSHAMAAPLPSGLVPPFQMKENSPGEAVPRPGQAVLFNSPDTAVAPQFGGELRRAHVYNPASSMTGPESIWRYIRLGNRLESRGGTVHLGSLPGLPVSGTESPIRLVDGEAVTALSQSKDVMTQRSHPLPPQALQPAGWTAPHAISPEWSERALGKPGANPAPMQMLSLPIGREPSSPGELAGPDGPNRAGQRNEAKSTNLRGADQMAFTDRKLIPAPDRRSLVLPLASADSHRLDHVVREDGPQTVHPHRQGSRSPMAHTQDAAVRRIRPSSPAPKVYRQEHLPVAQKELWEVLLEKQTTTQTLATPMEPLRGPMDRQAEMLTWRAMGSSHTHGHPAEDKGSLLPHPQEAGFILGRVPEEMQIAPEMRMRSATVPEERRNESPEKHRIMPSGLLSDGAPVFTVHAGFSGTANNAPVPGPDQPHPATAEAPPAWRIPSPHPTAALVYRREASANEQGGEREAQEDISFVKKNTTRTVREQQEQRVTTTTISAHGTDGAELGRLLEIIESPETVNRVADRVYRVLERRLRTERLRKGLL